MFNGLKCWIINLLAMLTLNNFFMHRVSTANFQFLMIIMFHCGLYCRAVSTGTPLITRLSYTAVVHLTRFFQTKNRGKILSSTVFFRKKAKNWTKKISLEIFWNCFRHFFSSSYVDFNLYFAQKLDFRS